MQNGKTINELPHLDFSKATIVLVTGALPNTCGHLILAVKNTSGISEYFHYDGPTMLTRPRYMTSNEYFHYLKVNKKIELLRKEVSLPYPEKAREKLLHLMQHQWMTFLFSHNCGSFVKTVINAGGNFWAFSEYCPVIGMGIAVYMDRYKR